MNVLSGLTVFIFLHSFKASLGGGPAYKNGLDQCPSGGRVLHFVNNCPDTRWFKLDGRTTPQFARPSCPYASVACSTTPGSDPLGVADCGNKIRRQFNMDPGIVYCINGFCNCNPNFEIPSGRDMKLTFPEGQNWPSGTGWLAQGCNQLGGGCAVGDSLIRNSQFEFFYADGKVVYYISAVNAWTTVSPVGVRSCGPHSDNPSDPYWCGAAGCDFDVNAHCPDGSVSFSAGQGPDGNTANLVATGTVFNANNVGGDQWVWRGPPDFAQHFGSPEGLHANRRFYCDAGGCTHISDVHSINTCLSGCDYCTNVLNTVPESNECIKYCCPDRVQYYSGYPYRYDSAGCLALGVQQGTDYTATLNGRCKLISTYIYQDPMVSFKCDGTVSLQVMACPDTTDFPLSHN